MQYILSKRIQNAEALLRNPNYNISEIARIVGYDNALYFSAPSKKEKGCPLPSIVKVFLNKKGNGYRWTAATLIIVPLLQVLSSSFFLLASNFAFHVIYSSQETKKGEQRYEKQITSFYRKYFKILCRFIGSRLLSPRLLSP